MRRSLLKWAVLAVTLAVLSALTAQAGSAKPSGGGKPSEGGKLPGTEQSHGTPATHGEVVDQIVQCFGPRAKETVTSLRARGWGYGEIVKALYLAQKSGKGINDIAGMKASGLGWGQIVQKLGLHPGELGKAERSCHHGGQAGGKPK